MMHLEELIFKFNSFTDCALSEEDDEIFLEILMERDKIFDIITQTETSLTWVRMEHLIKEQEILKRLENIKSKVLKSMENLTQRKKALLSYRSRFPFPPMPAFFEREE
ncbi:MAG: hypothetical protein N2513_01525 [Deltaproteobacteria bacterium]|nr:hypothetical protein [Deltaproteobacteria bacterium]